MSQLRVLQVASGDLWGGAEASIFELCRSLRERGIAVSAVILNPGELASRLTAAGVSTTVMNERSQSSLRIFGGLRHIAAVFRPDIVHSHRKKEHILACAAVRAVPAARAALVKTVHGAPEPRARSPGLRARVSNSVERWCERQFDVRVAVSADLATALQRDPGAAVVMVHNGIRSPEVQVGRERARPHIPVVGFAGRFVQIKRLDLLIKVAAAARDLAPGAVRFEIVGDGPLRAELTAQARALQVTDIVTFVPFQQNIWSMLAGWDAAILTSDHEGLPMICLEALASGVPVFARNVGGLRELVLGPEQGALLDSTDPAEMAARLLRFLGEPSGAPAGRSRLPPAFTADSMCDGYLGVYERVRRV
jgi:glycosyltransferase involved in cell wall biosynthesis